MGEKYKKTCKYLNYVENVFIIASTVPGGCVLIFAFASLVCVPVEITSSSVGITICTITAGIKKYKPVLSGKDKLNTIKFLI